MSQNLTMSPDLGTEDWDAHVSEQEIVTAFHMLDLPLTIKNTCYGSMISGKSEDVYKAIEEIRKLDPNHIFTKERGFAPGDPRRCRGHRFGPREGFHQMEKEYRILGFVANALEERKDVKIEPKKPVDVDEFEKIMNECLDKKE